MTPVFQTRFGKDGNCWAACLATVFDAALAETDPCACNNPDWISQTERFLGKRGYSYVEIRRNPDGGWPITQFGNGTVCILGVRTTRGLPHVIVCEVVNNPGLIAFNLLHDPLPDSQMENYTHCDSVILFIPLPNRLPPKGRIPNLDYCEPPAPDCLRQ